VENKGLELGVLLLFVGVLESLEAQVDQGLDETFVDLLVVPEVSNACLLV